VREGFLSDSNQRQILVKGAQAKRREDAEAVFIGIADYIRDLPEVSGHGREDIRRNTVFSSSSSLLE